MSVRAKIIHLLKFPPKIIAQKVVNRVKERLGRGQHQNTIINNDLRTEPFKDIRSKVFDIEWFSAKHLDENSFRFLGKMFTSHRFDTLGTSWITNSYKANSPGNEDYLYEERLHIEEFDEEGKWLEKVVHVNHIKTSQKLWQAILSLNKDYHPIDWQRDMKSGFRWSAKTWFREQRQMSDDRPGVDIKMPWELSRLQHLPRLVMCAIKFPEEREEFCTEITCQILDFMMANPIGMGVNFNCPMDIGIRNANLLITNDLLRQLSPKHTWFINDALSSYTEQSTIHILSDIEYREGKTSNHYLGNILGILYAGLYLETSFWSSSFLAFGIQELRSSMLRQFFNDGSNFEGSTAYHRLSGEMMIYGAAAVLLAGHDQLNAVNKLPLSLWKYNAPLTSNDTSWIRDSKDEFWIRLSRSASFSRDIQKPNGDIPQFGDNDSGRFLCLSPIGFWFSTPELIVKYAQLQDITLLPAETIFDENVLNPEAFISSVHGLLNVPPTDQSSMLEYDLFKAIRENAKFSHEANTEIVEIPDANFSNYVNWPHHEIKRYEFPSSVGLDKDIVSLVYPDFGLAICKSDRLYLALAGISNPNQHHSLSHVHNDKGSVEMFVDGVEILTDPGTYLYTPIAIRREEMRSIEAHNTINTGREQNKPLPGKMGLFNLHQMTTCIGPIIADNKMMVEIHYENVQHYREVIIESSAIEIRDWCNTPFTQQFNNAPAYSNGYGKLIRT